jgi:hypothetical protein
MKWVIALIVVVIVPFGIVLWLIPHYDAIGVQKAKDRIHANLQPHKDDLRSYVCAEPILLSFHLS